MQNELEQAIAGTGHNNPPSETELIALKLDEDNQDLILRHNELIEALSRLPEKVETPEMAQKLTTYGSQVQDCISKLELRRKEKKKLYDDMAAVVHQFFKIKQDSLFSAIAKVKVVLKVYDDGERQKKEKEIAAQKMRDAEEAERKKAEADKLASEAAALEQAGMAKAAEQKMAEAAQVEQKAVEAAEAAAAPTIAPKAIIRGSAGGSASSRSKWAVKIVDMETLDMKAILPFIDREALEKAARAWMNLAVKQIGPNDDPPKLAGLEVYRDTSMAFRR